MLIPHRHVSKCFTYLEARMKLRRDDQSIVLVGIYEFLEDTKLLDA